MRDMSMRASGALANGGALDHGTAGIEGGGSSAPLRLPIGRSIYQASFRLGTAEPPSVTMLKDLLGPSVAVATLAVCMWLGGSHLSVDFLALAVIVFLISGRILTTPELHTTADGSCEVRPKRLRLLLESATIAAVVAFLVMALRLTGEVGQRALTAWLFLAPAALMLSNAAAIRLTRWYTTHGPARSRQIIIGATDAGLELAKRVQQGGDGDFLGFFDFRDPTRLPVPASRQWIGSCESVTEFVQRNAVGTIYIALPISTAPRISELLRRLRDTTASIYFIPSNIFSFDLIQPRCLEIHGIPALAVCETPHLGLPGLQKRALDYALALGVLLLAGPLMLLIAAAVKLSSKGPVLFKQRRYGLNGEEIAVYKFRSMTVCEDGAAVVQATRDDCRTTAVGRFLRRSSLDELPQVLNVLRGTMSFVGPRPHAVAHNETYRKLISGYMIRHKVRPGITGWAQVNGLRGETDTLEKMRRRVDYDIEYLTNWSLWLDLKILLRTLLLVLHDEHAY